MVETVANLTSKNGKLYAGMTRQGIREQVGAQEFKNGRKREKAYRKELNIFNYADGLADGEKDGVISEEEIVAYDKKMKRKKIWKTIAVTAAVIGVVAGAALFLSKTKFGKILCDCFKEMKGANNIKEPEGYNKAVDYVKSLPEEKWAEMSKAMFVQKGDAKSEFLSRFEEAGKYLSENKGSVPEEVMESYNTIKGKAELFADRMNKAVSLGKNPLKTDGYNAKFILKHQKDFDNLQNFFESAGMGEKFNITEIAGNTKLYQDKIGAISEGILQEGQSYYHGTKHARAIIKNQGFSLFPKKGQGNMSARELGEAIYLTPDKRVASSYAGYKGRVLHLDVNIEKTAVANSTQMQRMEEYARNLAETPNSNAEIELIVKEAFLRNGYNTAYTRSALGLEEMKEYIDLVDKCAGGKQSQLAVFNPEDITIKSKSLRDIITDRYNQLIVCTKKKYLVTSYLSKGLKNMVKEIINLKKSNNINTSETGKRLLAQEELSHLFKDKQLTEEEYKSLLDIYSRG